MTSAATLPLSVEFFPPNTPVGSEKLKTVVKDLSVLKPEFFSVTYGAGGSTREKTLATVRDIAAAGHEAAPHLSCVGSTRESIAEILATYRAQGIRRLVALRGDLPSGTAVAGEFRYAAELIRFIRNNPQHKATPLIIISTEGKERDRDKGLGLGANAFLVKPFQPEDLLELVKKHVTTD